MIRPHQMTPASQGIALMIGAIFCLSLMDANAKALSSTVGTTQILWSRYTGLTVFVLLLVNRHISAALRTNALGLHLLRTMFILLGTTFFFFGLAHIGLAEATAIMALNPIFITLGATLFLGERLGVRRIFGILAALVGAYMIIRPGSQVFSPYAILPIGAALCLAGFAITARYIGKSESIWTSMLYTGVVSTVILTAIIPFYWVPPDTADMLHMLGVAVFGGGGQFLMISALMRAEAGVVAPFTYSGLLFATVWGMLFFDEYPDTMTLAGGLVIVLAGIYVWYRETHART